MRMIQDWLDFEKGYAWTFLSLLEKWIRVVCNQKEKYQKFGRNLHVTNVQKETEHSNGIHP